MAQNEQHRTHDEHSGCLTLVVNVVTQDRCDTYSKQREHRKHCFGTLTHIAHVAEHNQGYNGQAEQGVFHLCLLWKVAGKCSCGHNKHDDILNDGHRVRCPKWIGGYFGKRKVALQHVYCILLEGEDGWVVKYTEKGYKPETAAGKDFTQVADFEGIVFFFCFAGLCIKFLVHEEVNAEHQQRNHKQNHTEGYWTRNVYRTTQFCKYGRENHTSSHTQTGQCHFRTHGQCHFAALEPFNDTTRYGNTCHFHTATENHKTYGCKFGRRGHA